MKQTKSGTLEELLRQLRVVDSSADIIWGEISGKILEIPAITTADWAMYRMENDEPYLYLAFMGSPFFENPQDAIRQFEEMGNYRPRRKDVDWIVRTSGEVYDPNITYD